MKILLVDDAKLVQKSVGDFLIRCGHTLLTASDGAEALTRLEGNPVDVVISDIRMPVMHGVRLLEAVRDQYPSIPVVLITGHGDENTAETVAKIGAASFLKKPLKLDELVSILESVVPPERCEEPLPEPCAGGTSSVGAAAALVADEIDAPARCILEDVQAFLDLWEDAEPILKRVCRAEGDNGDLTVLVEEWPRLSARIGTSAEQIVTSASQLRLFH